MNAPLADIVPSRWLDRPLVLAAELMMAAETFAQLRAWVEGGEGATGRTEARLATYRTVDDVPADWLRLLLP
jgi:hypothetical protein